MDEAAVWVGMTTSTAVEATEKKCLSARADGTKLKHFLYLEEQNAQVKH